ncbi:huntingtin interacting protein, putative [Ixodes scapularis]|uniref:[histone H3]-lysine(36) N-trimethyltransferase n=1 Tax=Ixodes scapularis TaxID=6945 RepID=B7QG36_IXOSC|nr:huntingtin interacting protein, putative [Ixodes scapularis]|eukprot:XP_002401135.1 huntingtin interacting protein, putative [Ixodes scapularis]
MVRLPSFWGSSVAGSAPAKNCVVVVSVNHGASEDSDHEVLAEDLAAEEVATTMEVVTMEVETTVEEEDGGRSADSGSTQDDSSFTSATDSQASSNDGLTVKRRRGRPLKGSQSPKVSGAKTMESAASSKAPATRRSVRLRSGDGQRSSSPTPAAAKRGRRMMTEPVEEEVCTLGEVEEEEKKMSEEETKVEATNAGQVTDVVMEEQRGDQKEVVMRLEPLLDTEKRREDRLKSDCSDSSPESFPASRVEVKEEDEVVAVTESGTAEPLQPRAHPESETVSEVEAPPQPEQPVSPKPELSDTSEPKLTSQPTEPKTTSEPAVEPTEKPVAVVETAEHTTTDESKKIRDSKMGEKGPDLEAEEVRAVSADHRDRRYYSSPEKPTVSQDEAPARVLTPRSARRKSRWEDAPPNDVSEPAVAALDFSDASMALRDGHAEGAGASTYDTGGAEGVALPPPPPPRTTSPQRKEGAVDASGRPEKPTDTRPARAYDAKEDTKRNSTLSREETREKTPPSTPSRESRDRESRESGRGGESSREKGSPSRSLAYEDIEENLYRKKSKCKKEVRRMICDCSLTKDERDRGIMGCEEDCLNRLLMIECGSRCPNGDSCSNRRFQKKSYIKVEKFLTEKKGWGLRTVETLASGAFVMEYVGEVLTPEDFRKRVKQYARDNHQHYYFMALRSDEIIDATQKGNVSRFINHSCDPNCETQKWTVNGELRIGFFTRRPLRAGEELTFDYQFQRYGKEAQKCYCESSKCRGFIGEDNKMSLKSGRALAPKRVSNSSSRRAEERKRDIRLGGGLRNRKHTLLLARLMVRGEDIETRKRLLNIITSTTETACLRLFLDYHGLSLLWSWMLERATSRRGHPQILTVLRRLPIPNKTMVKDSKVMSVVHRWASQLAEARERPRECTTPASGASRRSLTGAVVCSPDSTNPVENGDSAERPKGPADDGGKVVKELSQLASTLLDSWSELKEVFRIPRLEQQKRREDEREADRKEREHNRQQRSRESSSSAASGRDSRRRGSPPSSGRDRRDHRDYDRSSDRRRYSASPEHRDDKKSYQRSSDGRSSRSGDPAPSSSSKPRKTLLPTPPRLSKEERRQLFALEVQQRDQEEALRRQYLAPPANGANPAPPMPGASFLPPPGMAQAPPPGVVPALVASGPPPQQNPLFVYDPATAAAVAAAMYGAQPPPGPAYYDPRAGMPPQEYVMQHNTMLGGIPPQQQPQPPHQGMPMGAPLLPAGAMLPGQQQMGPMGTLGPPLPMEESSNQLPPQHAAINYQALSAAVAAVSNLQPRVPSPAAPPPEASIFLTDPMQIPLPPSLSPDTGEVTPQNPDPLSSPPPFEEEEAIAVAQGGFPDASSAEARGAPTQRAPLEYEQIPRVAPSPVQEQTQQVVYPPAQHTPPTSMPYAPPGAMVAATAAPVPAGLFQANPQPMGPYGPGYVAAGPGQPMGAVQGMAQALPQGMPQVYYLPPIPAHAIPAEQPSKKKTLTAAADTSEVAKKIKELFRSKISSHIVHCLNPFRKPDCKLGRIQSTEDFKHLARKLTHFVMAKELKHCKNVEDLECNDNVKHKAKEFVHKYMAKYGPLFYKKDKAVSPKDE